jgi:ADP-heptose:LPS heptosyltransferase
MSSKVARQPRILFARPDHFGDILLTLPAVAALRRAVPDAQISFLVPAGLHAVPRLCPAIDEIYTAPFPPLTAWPGTHDWPNIAAQQAGVLHGRFDLAILPRPDDPVTGQLIADADIPIRLGYDCLRTRPFLTMALPSPQLCHVMELALELVKAAAGYFGAQGSFDLQTPVQLVPTAMEEAEAQTVLEGSGTNNRSGPLVLHAGSGWPLKNWPVHRWGELAAALQQRYGSPPLVTGSRTESELVDAVVDASGGRAHGIAGKLSLGGLAALYRRARLVIANDSGPLHLAALAGASVVGLYGPADPAQFSPCCPADRARIVRVQLPCSPCRTLIDPPCGASTMPTCLTDITVQAVLTAAADVLDR